MDKNALKSKVPYTGDMSRDRHIIKSSTPKFKGHLQGQKSLGRCRKKILKLSFSYSNFSSKSGGCVSSNETGRG